MRARKHVKEKRKI